MRHTEVIMERDARKYSRPIGLRFLLALSMALLVCLFSLPVQAQTTFVFDTFTASNGTLLENHNPDTGDSSSWSRISGTINLVINSNHIEPSDKNVAVYYKNTTAPGSADYVVSAIANWGSAVGSVKIYLMGRISNSDQDRYEVVVDGGGGVTISRYIGGSGPTTVQSCSTTNFTKDTNYRLAFKMYGSSLMVFVDGAEVSGCTTTDSSITASGNAGIGPDPSNKATNIFADDFYVSTLTITAVNLSSFSATQHNRGVMLKWRTGFEVDNLGFHVYREEGGEKHRITKEMIKGSALKTGPGHITAGYSYTWWDTGAAIGLLTLEDRPSASRQENLLPQAKRSSSETLLKRSAPFVTGWKMWI